ncbi:MAG: helix-turn-helix transcriptional regulator [Dehalococcoidales bacterium]|nr:helix-turn-helix transcriptional regulator [Dehalococcoidales bacterium]
MEAGNGRRKEFGLMLRQQRLMIPMTLHDLTLKSGVSPSYLGRIERGERFPSATILQRIARPLGFDIDELFTLAGYLSTQPAAVSEASPDYSGNHLDPYVYRVLSQEPIAAQRAVIGIISILRSIAKVDNA